MAEALKVDRCFEPYLPDKGRIEDVEKAYREAVREVHPDNGGHTKAISRVNQSLDHLSNIMEGSKTYDFQPRYYTMVHKPRKEEKGSHTNEEVWEKALEEANRMGERKYEMVEFRRLEQDKFFGKFENCSSLPFALELDKQEDKISYRTTYFRDGKGKIEEYTETEILSENKNFEDHIRDVLRSSVSGSQYLDD